MLSQFNFIFKKINNRQLLLLSSLLAIMLFDHYTTYLGLSQGLYESNASVIFLINNNIWLILDLFITLLLFLIPLSLSLYLNDAHVKLIYIMPIITLLLRSAVCYNNIILILSL